jgi:hypothetical protein
MKTEFKQDPSPLADMDPEELLKRHANFKNYQALGACLGYNPQITAAGSALPLNDWNYDELDADCQKGLDRWTKSKQAAPEIVRQLLNAATSLWGSARTYRELLNEVVEQLKIKSPTGWTLDDHEKTIAHNLLEKALKDIEKLPPDKQAKFNEEIGEFLRRKGIDLGSQSAIDYLKTAGTVGLGTLAGTQIVMGIVLANLGIVHAVLFAAGLWAPAGMLIGGAVAAPLTAGVLVYNYGKHNFKKTIPCVGIISELRQQAMLEKGSL